MAEENGNVQVDFRITVRSTRKGYTAYVNIAGEKFHGSATYRVDAIYQLLVNIGCGSTEYVNRFKDSIELLLDGTTLEKAIQPTTIKDINGHDEKHEGDKK